MNERIETGMVKIGGELQTKLKNQGCFTKKLIGYPWFFIKFRNIISYNQIIYQSPPTLF
jgi:hypothetical protein